MGWDSDCRYKILGYRINFEGETLYVFDLLVPEIFHEGQKRKKGESAPQSEETKPVNTRKGFYPDDIAGTFGVPVEEHLKESEVKQIDGCCVNQGFHWYKTDYLAANNRDAITLGFDTC